MSEHSSQRSMRQRVVPGRRMAVLGAMVTACAVGLSGTPALAADTDTRRPVAAASTAASVAKEQERVRAVLEHLVAKKIPGAVATVRHGDQVSHAAAGLADVESGQEMTPKHHFRVGSNTKVFTATVVLQLVGENRLSLDDSVEKLLPGTLRDIERITVRQLLNHTSGLDDYANHLTSMQRTYRPHELVAMADERERLFVPGARWEYSNTNYVLLGMIVEAVSGRSFTEELHRRIIVPLRLHDTRLPLTTSRIQGRYAHGYLLNSPDGTLPDETVENPSWAWTAGAMTSTTTDLARFQRALLGGDLLKPEQLAQMKETVPMGADPTRSYGLGLMRNTADGTTLWGHNGQIPGYFTAAFTSEDGRHQVVLAVNGNPNSFNQLQFLGIRDAMAELFEHSS
ncbi:serine hydrolase domain-containing protein [Streptomyces chromofuscus]|uniref:Beta-lactamase family protein n=1 Tax=Streptomyces chromofuscus TaxID=42881 RepID=A0A7M2T8N0_STRCW|nr:serine hydrolase domain-containing protein [Streptomyces chromofuscus]QOV44604.1 beta-lactamase family protein [Streptomyces chromofuscus]GGT01903.1 serine hydrolase [Streptomyces chromofuscus]